MLISVSEKKHFIVLFIIIIRKLSFPVSLVQFENSMFARFFGRKSPCTSVPDHADKLCGSTVSPVLDGKGPATVHCCGRRHELNRTKLVDLVISCYTVAPYYWIIRPRSACVPDAGLTPKPYYNALIGHAHNPASPQTYNYQTRFHKQASESEVTNLSGALV